MTFMQKNKTLKEKKNTFIEDNGFDGLTPWIVL